MRLARYRFRLAQRAIGPWAVAAGLAIVTGVAISGSVSAAKHARDRWLPTRPVVVTTRLVHPGEVLDGANTTKAPVPSGQGGADLLDALPAGSTAAVTLYRGEPVRRARLAGPTAAAPGTRVVALPLTDRTPPVVPGDRIDIVGTGSTETTAIAHNAAVIAVSDGRAVVAVDPSEVANLADALATGGVVVAVVK